VAKGFYIEPGADFSLCPGCGQRVLRGAMRCMRCGQPLITLQEQLERIEKLKKAKKGRGAGRLLWFALLLLASGVAYHFFSESILAFLRGMAGR
jgi:hypothetical protein